MLTLWFENTTEPIGLKHLLQQCGAANLLVAPSTIPLGTAIWSAVLVVILVVIVVVIL